MNRYTSKSFLLVIGAWLAFGPTVLADDPGTGNSAATLQRLKAKALVAEEHGDQVMLLKSLRGIRDLQARCGALDSALHIGIRIVGMSGVADDRLAMAGDWGAMSGIYRKLGSPSEAVDAQRRSLVILRTTNEPKLIRPATLDLLDLLLAAGRYDELKHSSDEALQEFQRIGDRDGQVRVMVLQGECLRQQGRAADALSILHLALRDIDTLGDGTEKAHALFALAHADADVQDWGDARAAFDQALALDRHAPDKDPSLHGLCARIDEGEGDLAQALRCERLQIDGRDSLLRLTKAEQLVQLQALYALKLKDHDLSVLRSTNETVVAALGSEQWRGRAALMLSMALFTVVVLLLLLRGKHMGMLRRVRMKNALINRQANEIHTKNIELEHQNLRLRETLENEQEKDLVLRDVHFRTKNSLQVINALLKMQGVHANDPRMDELLGDCQSRIHSMALVHEHIYKCGDLNRVNVKAHFVALAEAVLRHHGLQERMQVEFDITRDRATLEELLPLSLLLNELLANSAKHASTNDRSGRILIVLRPLAEQRCELLFTDEGTGLEQERFLRADSFSAELVRTLAKQLNGRIHLLKSEVITFQMTFDNADREEMRMAS